MWLTLREHRSPWLAALGAVILMLYGVVPTLQPAPFARTYAAYGGAFIGLSLLWGRIVERTQPDLPDLIGGAVALLGSAIIMYWPRS